jgi:hypothetical protein
VSAAEQLKALCRGNESALEFCTAIVNIAAWYDDLIDRDVPVTDEMIHRLMWDALVTLPRNLFYQQNFIVLNPLVINTIHNWRIANELEKSQAGKDDLSIAFVIRSSYADILRMVALLIGGESYALECGVAIRRYVHDEGFEAYRAEMSPQEGV